MWSLVRIQSPRQNRTRKSSIERLETFLFCGIGELVRQGCRETQKQVARDRGFRGGFVQAIKGLPGKASQSGRRPRSSQSSLRRQKRRFAPFAQYFGLVDCFFWLRGEMISNFSGRPASPSDFESSLSGATRKGVAMRSQAAQQSIQSS